MKHEIIKFYEVTKTREINQIHLYKAREHNNNIAQYDNNLS